MQINLESTGSLHSLTEENLSELGAIYEEDYMIHGIAGNLPRDEMVFVDLDMSGFRADGKTYEGTAKGYVGHKHVKRNGKIEFWHLLTNLPDILYLLQMMMFDLYHERQGIEAYLKSDKSGLHPKNLRIRNPSSESRD